MVASAVVGSTYCLPADGQRAADQPIANQPLSILLQRACSADSDPASWKELMRRFGRLLLYTARRMGLNDCDATEVEQQTWIRLWERGDRIRDPDSLAAWLTATARRESLRLAIKTNRCLLSADPAEEYGWRPTNCASDIYPVDGEYEPVLEQALTRLPIVHEQVIRMLMSDSCPTYLEVAKRLRLPVGSIGPIRMRALQMLRDSPELVRMGSAVSPPVAQPL